MRVLLHTPAGIVEHELTPAELTRWAADGHLEARREILLADMPQHTDPHLKIELIMWALGIIDTKPQIPGPP